MPTLDSRLAWRQPPAHLDLAYAVVPPHHRETDLASAAESPVVGERARSTVGGGAQGGGGRSLCWCRFASTTAPGRSPRPRCTRVRARRVASCSRRCSRPTAPTTTWPSWEVTAYVEGGGSLTADGGPYGFEVGFRPHRVGLNQAEAMVRTLRKLTRGLRGMDETRGYVREGDFLTYLTRVAELLGIKHFYVHATERQREMTGQRYHRVDGGGLQQWLLDVAKNNYPVSRPGRGERW